MNDLLKPPWLALLLSAGIVGVANAGHPCIRHPCMRDPCIRDPCVRRPCVRLPCGPLPTTCVTCSRTPCVCIFVAPATSRLPPKADVIALPDTRPSRLNAPLNTPINGESWRHDSGAGVLHHPVSPGDCGSNPLPPDASWDGRSIPGPSWHVPFGRTDVVSGARLTVLANYLQHVPGTVHLIVAGTTSSCRITAWSDTSVTVDLPNLGLRRTMDAVIRVIRPDGRVAKTIPVNLIPAPTVIMHRWNAVQRVSHTVGIGIYAD